MFNAYSENCPLTIFCNQFRESKSSWALLQDYKCQHKKHCPCKMYVPHTCYIAISVITHSLQCNGTGTFIVSSTNCIYPYRNLGIYFISSDFDLAFIWTHFAFYIGIYIKVLNICDYLGPDVYTSSAFIRINTVNWSSQEIILNNLYKLLISLVGILFNTH